MRVISRKRLRGYGGGERMNYFARGIDFTPFVHSRTPRVPFSALSSRILRELDIVICRGKKMRADSRLRVPKRWNYISFAEIAVQIIHAARKKSLYPRFYRTLYAK